MTNGGQPRAFTQSNAISDSASRLRHKWDESGSCGDESGKSRDESAEGWDESAVKSSDQCAPQPLPRFVQHKSLVDNFRRIGRGAHRRWKVAVAVGCEAKCGNRSE